VLWASCIQVAKLQKCLKKYIEAENKFARKKENPFVNETGKPKKVKRKTKLRLKVKHVHGIHCGT
jgi:hypothetical protein